MSLIVEDGTMVAGAESYASVSDADTYLSSRGITTWANLLQPEKEQALRRATDFMREYPWKGYIIDTEQALDWPRQKVYVVNNIEVANDFIPLGVKNACIELAWRGAGGPLNPDIQGDDTNRFITKKVERVGPVDVETTYASRGSLASPARPEYPAVVVMLRPYLNTGSGVIR